MTDIKFKISSVKIPRSILISIERYLDVRLPKSYREFLLNYNGGYPLHRTKFIINGDEDCYDDFVIKAFLGINDNIYIDLLWYRIMYTGRIPRNMLPIATDTFGNMVLLATKMHDYGKVYFWDHEREADTFQGEVPNYSNLTLIANSFDEFVGNLKHAY